MAKSLATTSAHAKALICCGFAADSSSPTLISDTMTLFDSDKLKMSLKQMTDFSTRVTISEDSVAYAKDTAASFKVEGAYAGFAAAAEASLEKRASGSSKTLRVNHDLFAVQWHATNDLLDYSVALRPDVVKFVKNSSAETIVKRIGHFFPQQIKLGGQMQVSRIINVNESDSASSMRGKITASYNSCLASISGSVEASKETAETMGGRTENVAITVRGGDQKCWLAFSNAPEGEPGSHSVCQANWADSLDGSEMYPLEMELVPIWKAFQGEDPELRDKAKELQSFLQTKLWPTELAAVTEKIKHRLSASEAAERKRKLRAIKNGHTPANADGGGRTNYLDRHKVMAPAGSGVLTGFGMRRPTEDTLNYEFSYVEHPSAGSSINVHYTPWNNDDHRGGYKTIYLDRHKVMVPSGHVLVGFQLRCNSSGQYRYEYWSREAPCGTTREDQTKPSDWGKGNVMYLDRQRIDVPEGCGLRGFQLYRPSGDTIAYRYWFAPLSA